MVVRDGEKALVGWATTKSGDTAPATVVDGSQTSHSLQLAVRTEMRTKRIFLFAKRVTAKRSTAAVRHTARFLPRGCETLILQLFNAPQGLPRT